jgi:hypothetical protein
MFGPMRLRYRLLAAVTVWWVGRARFSAHTAAPKYSSQFVLANRSNIVHARSTMMFDGCVVAPLFANTLGLNTFRETTTVFFITLAEKWTASTAADPRFFLLMGLFQTFERIRMHLRYIIRSGEQLEALHSYRENLVGTMTLKCEIQRGRLHEKKRFQGRWHVILFLFLKTNHRP